MSGPKSILFAEPPPLYGQRFETRDGALETQTGIFGTATSIFPVAPPAPAAVASTGSVHHRFSVPRLALPLAIGLVIGALLFLTVGSHGRDLATTAADTSRAVAVTEGSAAIAISVTAAGSAPALAVVEELPSLEHHISASPVSVAPRRFLFADSPGRSSQVHFIAPRLDAPAPKDLRLPSREALRLSASAPGRYTTGGPVEWQGGFRPLDPGANSHKGQAYLDYLEQTVGPGFGDKLSVISGERTRLLDVITKTGRGPLDLRR